MSEEIIKVLDALGEKFGIAVDWTGENVLPYVEELFQKATNWLIGEATVLLICATIGFVLALLVFIKLWKSWVGDDEELAFPVIIIGALTILPCLVAMIINMLQIVKCCTCPELALLPFISGLM